MLATTRRRAALPDTMSLREHRYEFAVTTSMPLRIATRDYKFHFAARADLRRIGLHVEIKRSEAVVQLHLNALFAYLNAPQNT